MKLNLWTLLTFGAKTLNQSSKSCQSCFFQHCLNPTVHYYDTSKINPKSVAPVVPLGSILLLYRRHSTY